MMKKLLLAVLSLCFVGLLHAQQGSEWTNPIIFDWENGNLQQADAGTVWYKVDLADVDKSSNLLLYLNNVDSEVANVSAQPYVEDGGRIWELAELQEKAIQVGRNYAYELTSGLIRNLKSVYLVLTTDHDIRFSAVPVEPGKKDMACLNGTAFNWDGTTYTSGKQWYTIDLSDAFLTENAEKVVEITVQNNASAAAQVSAGLSFDCPSTGTTDKSFTLSANATRRDTIKRSQLSMLAQEEVYIALQSSRSLTLSARLVTPAEPEPTLDVVDATALVLETEYTVQKDQSKWFAVTVADIDQKGELPEVTIYNDGGSTVSVTGDLVYAEQNATYITRTESTSAQKVIKDIQRNVVQQLSAHETVWFRLTPTADIRFSVRMKKSTENSDCVNADLFDMEKGELQKAGEISWYKVDISSVKATVNQSLRLHAKNLDATKGDVSVSAWFSCDDADPFGEQTHALGAGKHQTYDIARGLLVSLTADIVYIQVSTAAKDSLWVETITETVDPIDACLNDPQDVPLNVNIPHVAGEKWYKVDLFNLKSNIDEFSDVQLVILNGSEKNTIKAEVAWECPVTDAMAHRTTTLNANSRYSKIIARELIEQQNADYAYVRLTASADMTFRLDVIDNKGKTCTNPIDFDWVNGNIHLAGDTLWYKVRLDTLKPDSMKLKDLKLKVENLTSMPVHAKAYIYDDCAEDPLANEIDRTLAADDIAEKIASRSLLAAMGFVDLKILLIADGNVRLSAEIIDKVTIREYDTLQVVGTVCIGDTYTYQCADSTITHLIDENLSRWEWSDTIQFKYNSTQYADSIIWLEVHPMQAPLFPDQAELTDPQLKVGEVIDLSATTQSILDYFAAAQNDTVDAILPDELLWRMLDDDGNPVLVPTEPIAEGTLQLDFIYGITTAQCEEFLWSEMLSFDVAQPEIVFTRDTVYADTLQYYLCHGDSLLTPFDTLWVEQDTLYQPVRSIVDSVALTITDSVFTYQVVMKVPSELPVLEAEPKAVCGQVLDLADLKSELDAWVAQDTLIASAQVQQVVWQEKQDEEWIELDESRVLSKDEVVELRFLALTECQDTVAGEPIHVTVEPVTSFNSGIDVSVLGVTKYDGWLLMVNLNAFRELGYDSIAPENVRWHRVVGEPDEVFNNQGAAKDDEFLHVGYYHTEDTHLTGDYYALVVIPAVEATDCEAFLRTDVLKSQYKASAIRLVHTMLSKDEKLQLTGLDPEQQYTVVIYNLAGKTMRRMSVENAIQQQLPTEEPAGIYMLHIFSEKESQTIKYVVK